MKIPFSKMYMGDDIRHAVIRVLDSGRYVKGLEVAKFEKEFADYMGVKHAIATNSGSAAIYVAIAAMGLNHGIFSIPNITFGATAEAPLLGGGRIRYIDVNKDTMLMDIKEVNVTKCTAVIPVHLYGNPLDVEKIESKYIIEDCCQAHGAEINGKKVGTMGDIGVFSFYPSKNVSVCGEGGMLITNNSKYAERAKMIVDHGRQGQFKYKLLGFNWRMSEISAAIGRVHLKHLDEWNKRRREIAAIYDKGLEGVVEKVKYQGNPVYHQYVIKVDDRDKFGRYLLEMGVIWGIHYPYPLSTQKPLNGTCYRPTGNALKESKRILSLPISPFHTDEEINYVIKVIGDYFKNENGYFDFYT